MPEQSAPLVKMTGVAKSYGAVRARQHHDALAPGAPRRAALAQALRTPFDADAIVAASYDNGHEAAVAAA